MLGIDVTIGLLAREQSGAVTRAQLRALGLSDGGIARRVESGGLRRISAGVYLPSFVDPSFVTRATAAVLAHPGAAIARTWAAAWWGLGTFSPSSVGPPVDLLAPVGAQHRSALATIRRTRHLESADVVPLTEFEKAGVILAARDERRIKAGGRANMRTTAVRPKREALPHEVAALVVVPRVTTPARTIVDLLSTWMSHDNELDRLVDDALARALVTVSELAECTERVLRPRSPGRPSILEHLSKRGGGFVAPDSELERIGRAAFRAWRCPSPVLGFHIPSRGRLPGQVDFAFPRHKVLIELDGRRWHIGEHGFQADRARDRAALLAGWSPYRFTWTDFTRLKHITRAEVLRIFDFGPQ